ncbi:HD domain-containing protein [Virgibacillus sp. AGTR]|uniref:HD domain-containing protein n=1 Tax=Virgibacillus sp. AGTR TaxID=2812055 RepID=UPI001D163181|nr:HD domain-containing protein [Virgibacillus sp. AGTR]MCC2248917.1 HD domain-containing protein [Virgibacillus sp. AGTR]
MLKQKAVKTKSNVAIKNAEKIMDKKRNASTKMFKQTNRRKQRLLEKKETERIVDEYDQDQWGMDTMNTLNTKQRFDSNQHHKSSRVIHLEHQLAILGFSDSLRAFDLVLTEMNAENGFKRHDGFHYYYHLVDVAQILLNFGISDEDIITAALLHDFIEDVEWATYEYVQDQFNIRVADIVLLLTKKKSVDYKLNLNEMQRYLAGIASRYESALIKTADRIHNFSSMCNSSRNHRAKQVRETRDFYIPFFKECRNRYVRYSNFFFFAKTTIEPILHEIEYNLTKTEELEKEIEKLKTKLDAK